MQAVYVQKLNELELEQEELEYYKKKYKRTVAAASQQNWNAKVNRLNTSPNTPPDPQLQAELAALQAETERLESLKQLLEAEKAKYRRTKNKLSVHRAILTRTSEWSTYVSLDLGRKSYSENQLRGRN